MKVEKLPNEPKGRLSLSYFSIKCYSITLAQVAGKTNPFRAMLASGSRSKESLLRNLVSSKQTHRSQFLHNRGLVELTLKGGKFRSTNLVPYLSSMLFVPEHPRGAPG
jgi:hypothetical protein